MSLHVLADNSAPGGVAGRLEFRSFFLGVLAGVNMSVFYHLLLTEANERTSLTRRVYYFCGVAYVGACEPTKREGLV